MNGAKRDGLGPLVLYDGVCGLCHHAVRSLLRLDREGRFRFAPLQGETAHQLRTDHPDIPCDLSSVVFVEDGAVYLRSRAFIMMTRHFAYPWKAVFALRFVPSAFLDWGYRIVAAIRYRAWGKRDLCELPSAEQRARFLP